MVNLNMADEIAVVARWAISSRFLLLFSQVGVKKKKKNVAIGCESYFTFAHFFCSDFCQ